MVFLSAESGFGEGIRRRSQNSGSTDTVPKKAQEGMVEHHRFFAPFPKEGLKYFLVSRRLNAHSDFEILLKASIGLLVYDFDSIMSFL